MGRKKRRRSSSSPNQPFKRQRKTPYWIQDFPDLIPDGEKCDLTVWLTRVDLQDQHIPKGAESTKSKNKSIETTTTETLKPEENVDNAMEPKESNATEETDGVLHKNKASVDGIMKQAVAKDVNKNTECSGDFVPTDDPDYNEIKTNENTIDESEKSQSENGSDSEEDKMEQILEDMQELKKKIESSESSENKVFLDDENNDENEASDTNRSEDPVEADNPNKLETTKDDDKPIGGGDHENLAAKKVNEATTQSTDVIISIKRVTTPNNNSNVKKRKFQANFRHLPNGDCGDGIRNPYPQTEVLDKYWAQRKRLFSRFEDGIKLDADGWFSVTPESIANHISAKMLRNKGEGLVVLDAFAGVGGNSVAFAKQAEVAKVICVDTSLERLLLAANNCRVYEIPSEKLAFINLDVCEIFESYRNGKLILDAKEKGEKREICGYELGGLELLETRLDAIFLSPPWGGVDYESIGPRHYNLSSIVLNNGINGDDLLRLSCQALSSPYNIGYYLPRNLNGLVLSQTAAKCGIRGNLEIEQNILNGKLKTVMVYINSQEYK